MPMIQPKQGFEHGHTPAGELAQRGAGKEVDPQQFVPKVVRLAEIGAAPPNLAPFAFGSSRRV